MLTNLSAASRVVRSLHSSTRLASSLSTKDTYKVLVIGGGTGGLSVANQVYNRFKAAGKSLNSSDVAIIDDAEYHFYQPGWTLVGAGLRPKTDFRRPLQSLVPPYVDLVQDQVNSFSPDTSSITTASGRTINYETLVVAAGLQINWNAIQGLSQALANPTSGVSSIYSYHTCDKAWDDIESLRSGNAIFTQPAGVIKCAGAPQKIMWMAWDRYRTTGRGDNIKVDFYSGMPTMFAVKKYSDALEALRVKRGVGGHFQHNLESINTQDHTATFKAVDGSTITKDYTLLHVTPPMGPLDFIKASPIADGAGWVQVDQATLQHVKPEYSNIFSLGDCSSLPTSKTAAAITAQAPVLTENLVSLMTSGKISPHARYDGYTSCPLLTGYGELMLAEFKYGLEPKETFSGLLDQGQSQKLFYYLKKDLFPSAYWNFMVKGKWYGTKGLSRPTFP
ncbi:sulfide-quinone oxidoreductase [Pluteus cervinus]|uniref:Sulfide-quinone oxidoreductase n=1 Tax=Pluteus cervinus TaxID=181527 RepID=A0ACD3BF24_9AGAR|nr:sulfide-quinone oxidoreductase [Pluteus cervinus]